jgi:hypothetical protein
MKKAKKPAIKPGIRLRLSSAETWLNCPGSLDFVTGENPYSDRSSADAGTDFHNFMEFALNKFRDDQTVSAADFDLTGKPEEWVEWFPMCFNKIKTDFEIYAHLEGHAPELYVEEVLEYRVRKASPGAESVTIVGRADAYLLTRDTMIVYDFKTGFKPVAALNNSQLLATAHLIQQRHARGHKNTLGVIIQPSISAIEQSEMLLRDDFFARLLGNIDRSPRKLVLGTYCRYCKVSDICPAFRENLHKYLNPSYLDETLHRPQEWAEILEIAKPIQKALESLYSTALSYLQDGGEIPGWCLDKRGGRRGWNHNMTSHSLAKWLKLKESDVSRVALESPAVVEKVLKATFRDKKDFGKLVDKFNEITAKPEFFYPKKIASGDTFRAEPKEGSATRTKARAKLAKRGIETEAPKPATNSKAKTTTKRK